MGSCRWIQPAAARIWRAPQYNYCTHCTPDGRAWPAVQRIENVTGTAAIPMARLPWPPPHHAQARAARREKDHDAGVCRLLARPPSTAVHRSGSSSSDPLSTFM
jgi:hypothetical protein